MGARREVIGLRSDGEEFPIETSISHLHLDGQRLYTAILRDVSDSRRAEAALRDSEARLRQLLALLPDAVFVNSGGRIAFVNEAASRLFGADESALLGRLVLELIHPDSIEQVRTRVAALHDGATMVPPVELKVLRADGAVRSVESTDTRFVDHEEVSLIVVLRDVTELRQAQTALRESHADLQRLVEAQNSVQEDERKRIARELHDDLQQTLASIAINVAAIGERLPPDAAAAVPVLAEVGQLATAAIESTRRIVNDLRPQILEDLGLVPALEVMADQFERRSGMSCQLELDADAGDRVLAVAGDHHLPVPRDAGIAEQRGQARAGQPGANRSHRQRRRQRRAARRRRRPRHRCERPAQARFVRAARDAGARARRRRPAAGGKPAGRRHDGRGRRAARRRRARGLTLTVLTAGLPRPRTLCLAKVGGAAS